MGKLIAPNGAEIIGTHERIPGMAGIQNVTLTEGGKFDLEWTGDTQIDWDGQETETDAMTEGRIFIDENGESWLEHELTFKETEDAKA